MSTSTEPSIQPLIFEQFFELGQEETLSPFITPNSRDWSAHLTLKSAILAAFLLLISFILSFFPAWVPFSHLTLIGVYFLAGIPSLIEALEDLANFEVNIDILMTLAAFSSIFIGSGMEGGLLLVLFALSGSMEDAVRSKATSAINSLHKLSPTTAFVVQEDGTAVEKSIKEIAVGCLIRVKAGQIVPLDGLVKKGRSSVNLVHLTGESIPVPKSIGDEVPAGAQNIDGAISMEVTRTSNDSTLARIIELVTQAQDAKPKLQRWFDAQSRRYAISIILLAFIFAASFPFLLQIPFLGTEGSLYRALAFLIAASPCALIIALPIAYLSAISICARNGILMKGGVALDALASCKAIAFDKTGTLTTGELTCEPIESIAPSSQEKRQRALEIAAALEQNAIHPIARSIVSYAEEQKIRPAELAEFQSIPGFGLKGKVEEGEVFLGRPEYLIDKLPADKSGPLKTRMEDVQSKGEMLAVLSCGSDLFLFRFHDTVRPELKKTLDMLKSRWNLLIVMLTGDHENSARRVAEELGIDQWRAHLRPEDKLSAVSEISQSKGLAMVGDGINDAPALARSTVGVCMGQVGTTAAMDASDIVLLHDNIEMLSWLYGKAKKTQAIVKQNFLLATGAIIFASLPALFGIVPLWMAVILHEGGTILVGLNALRLLRK
ncbi:putative cadmium/zinc-transporting ATPase HMA1,chloroplastic [Waddlia chondrophila 2032/99]|uniref:Heavy metal translocating ATPase, P-type n=2 Tax=Waddlia chondrophila TaxID=71667 RepID=D6YSD4_WADCW|nr:cation-translocating P-type ATPase [Waddlia chondrophila]ADI38979.1 heavy metal translocating ATPase, P-type [Waddlia chondrophila WSU 86-1044]CCB92100.1 putative cadmium/zinc-transporting ATPase HMA1,chloroplastic [Waddlia chondrophila 2032/99]